jgi:type II secretory pathway pseudopilin PulG
MAYRVLQISPNGLESLDANMIVSFKKASGRETRAALAAFTLIEIMVALGVFVLVTSGMIYGYLQSNRDAEWSAMSLAAQSYAAQGVEQARAATWSISGSDDLKVPASPGYTNYFQTNTMQIPISGQPTNVITTITITSNSTPYQSRQIRADCVWKFPLTGTSFTNTVITERAPDQ